MKEPTISVLRNLESRIEGLVEGVFSRAFSSEVQPVELARKLAKEMDAHKTAGLARVYVPNEYTVFLSERGPHQAGGLRALARAGAVRLPAGARAAPRLRPADPARGRVQDRRAAAPRRVRDPDAPGQAPRPRGRRPAARARRATRWSTRPCASATARRSGPEQRAGAMVSTRAIVSLDDRRYVLDGPRATIGRSKDADCVLRDPNVSRRHAELRRSPSRRLGDRRPRLDQRRQGQRPSRRLDPAQPRRPGDPRHDHLRVRHRAVE